MGHRLQLPLVDQPARGELAGQPGGGRVVSGDAPGRGEQRPALFGPQPAVPGMQGLAQHAGGGLVVPAAYLHR